MENVKDLRQTKEWAKYLNSIGWESERVPDFLYIKRFPFLPWSVAKLQRAKNVDEKALRAACKKHRVVKLISAETVARKTIWIDLKKSQKQLLSEMKAKTRYNIGLAKRRKIEIKVIRGKDVFETEIFNLIKQNSRRLKIFQMPKDWFENKIKAFGDKCFGVVAHSTSSGCADKLLAVNMFYCSPASVFYAENGSTEMGRKLMAPTACVWQGILEAKRRKLKVFDFDGIWDGSKTLKRWQGFTRFKKSFGGQPRKFT